MTASPAKRFGVLAAILVIAAIAGATLAIGCFDKESKPKVVIPDPLAGYRPDTSADNVLWNLKKSWVELNSDAYASILNDGFTYVFAPQDVGWDSIPPTWGKADELLSARHLFSKTDANRAGYIATSVSLAFQQGPYIPNDMGTWTKVTLSQIFLTVTTRNKITSDPLDYLVQGDQANIWLTEEGGLWKIVRWEDKPIGALGPNGATVIPAGIATQPSTWGQIKGLFR